MPEEATTSVLAADRKTTAQTADDQNRARLTERIALIGAILGLFSIGLYVLLYLQTGPWQILADAGFVALAILCLVPTRWLARRGRLDSAGYWIVLAVILAYGGGTLVWAGTAIYNTAGGLLLILLAGSAIRPRKRGRWLLVAVLYLAFIALVEQFEPLPRYHIGQSPVLRLHVPAVTIALVLLTLWQVARAFQVGTIRTRLLISFVTMVLAPTLLIGAGAFAAAFVIGQQRVEAQLESVAVLKEAEINTWVENLQFDLLLALTGDEVTQRTIMLLQEPDPSVYPIGYSAVQNRFQQVLREPGRFEELFLMDLQGKVLLSTDVAQEGKIRYDQTYFGQGLQGTYVQPPFYSLSLGKTVVVAVQPVVNAQGQVVGVLGGRANLDRLDRIMGERAGLGTSGETYLVGANHVLLTTNRLGEKEIYVRTLGANEAIEGQDSGSESYNNYRDVVVFGSYRWLPELQVALLAEQERAEAFQAVYQLLGILGASVFVLAALAAAASVIVTRSIAKPLANLAETATQIADGDLARRATVEREDEVGTLARAFNSMTAQLRDLIGSLEERVADRTRALEQRSRYLQASADVGHAASSILETDRLIQQIVELIRENFDLYYVGLFQVAEEADNWAVLQAGTGAAGQAMLARGHRLRVGGDSMIGWSIANDQARIALEAGEDAVRLATPELPHTRSEAALPLHARGQVIGALTVQHTEPGAFDQDTIVVLQTMADQVAVALDNARLFAERQEALEAAQRAYGELSREAWARILRARQELGFRSDERGGVEAVDARSGRAEIEQALQTGQTVQGDGLGLDGRHPLAVPIKVRGQVIGVLDTYKPAEAGDWTSEEIALLEAIAGQLDAALESARLYQDTQRRAAREQAIRQVTERMRSAVDVETILQTTVTELARALGIPRAYVRLGTEAELQPWGDHAGSPLQPSDLIQMADPRSEADQAGDD